VSAQPSTEQHFSAAELAERWKLDQNTVRRLFRDEPGVLLIGNPRTTRHKRAYTTLRIPASVVERVWRRMSKVG
jgi:methylphosphotriester-DNA--protein-cysteine methyltransferase